MFQPLPRLMFTGGAAKGLGYSVSLRRGRISHMAVLLSPKLATLLERADPPRQPLQFLHLLRTPNRASYWRFQGADGSCSWEGNVAATREVTETSEYPSHDKY